MVRLPVIVYYYIGGYVTVLFECFSSYEIVLEYKTASINQRGEALVEKFPNTSLILGLFSTPLSILTD